jgi:hypothetical protein
MIEIYQDRIDQWRFRIKAANHKILASSEGYNQKESCINGIRSLLENVGVEKGVRTLLLNSIKEKKERVNDV